MLASDYRAEARLLLRGKWGPMAILECIAAMVVLAVASVAAVVLVLGPLTVCAIRGLKDMFSGGEAASYWLRLPLSFYAVLLLGLYLAGVAGSLMSVGLARAGRAVIRGERPEPGMLFDPLTLPEALAMSLLRTLIVGVGLMLLVVPGVIAAYRYALADYLIVTRPGLGARGALRESARRMKGRKGRLFAIQLPYLIWQAVCCLPLIAVRAVVALAAARGVPSALTLLTAPLAVLAAVAGLFLRGWMDVAVVMFARNACRRRRRRRAVA